MASKDSERDRIGKCPLVGMSMAVAVEGNIKVGDKIVVRTRRKPAATVSSYISSFFK